MNNKIITSFFLITAGIFFITGCSSISQSTRYSKNSKQEKESTANIRFNHEQDSVNNTSSHDSLLANEEDELEDYVADTSNIDAREILKKFTLNENAIDNDFGTSKEKMLMEIIRWLNTPYKYGGNTRHGIDCSAFTQTVFKNSLNVSLLRSAREQFTQGEDVEELKFGDLVFFNTRSRVRPGHVGIYLGDKIFAHSSSKLGVIVSSLEEGYYAERFMGGRRLEVFLQAGR
ncbi:MAG: NlpC/P60 family protein [Ignavibacteriaceae bacterium]|nr:NlpC/P60 family protein [Ignavibacteriaceae bacterium]